MTSDEQESSASGSPEDPGWKGKLRKILEIKLLPAGLRDKIEEAVAKGTLSELDAADVAIKKFADSLDVVELVIAAEELGFESALSRASTVKELLRILKQIEEDPRQR